MTSPVASLIGALMPKMSGANEFAVFFDDARRRTVLRSVFDGYYADVPVGHVVFDTNRTWTGRAALQAELYPSSRIICCVREVGWIIDSIERMLRKNPLQLSRVFNFQPGGSVLMNSDNDLIGLAWASFREAGFSEIADRLIVVSYDSLVSRPEATMKLLYDELDEAPFITTPISACQECTRFGTRSNTGNGKAVFRPTSLPSMGRRISGCGRS
jgi:sulfotransferase